LWRFQIPGALRQKYGYPELTESAKRKILGLNSARLYGIRAVKTGAYRPVPKDYESRMSSGRIRSAAIGVERGSVALLR
jgi:hypothetical protein